MEYEKALLNEIAELRVKRDNAEKELRRKTYVSGGLTALILATYDANLIQHLKDILDEAEGLE